MSGRLTLVYRDYDGDLKQSSFILASPASDGSDLATWTSEASALRDALSALSGGVMAEDRRTITETSGSSARAASPASQAHFRAIIQYSDDVTGKVYQDAFVPVPKLADDTLWETIGGVTRAKTGVTAVDTFIAAFEAHVLSVDGNAVTVQQIYVEGS